MDKTDLKNKREEIRRKIRVMEWDKKVNGFITKRHLYDQLKKEYKELGGKIINEKTEERQEPRFVHSST